MVEINLEYTYMNSIDRRRDDDASKPYLHVSYDVKNVKEGYTYNDTNTDYLNIKGIAVVDVGSLGMNIDLCRTFITSYLSRCEIELYGPMRPQDTYEDDNTLTYYADLEESFSFFEGMDFGPLAGYWENGDFNIDTIYIEIDMKNSIKQMDWTYELTNVEYAE